MGFMAVHFKMGDNRHCVHAYHEVDCVIRGVLLFLYESTRLISCVHVHPAFCTAFVNTLECG
jgi:hypothetical protein